MCKQRCDDLREGGGYADEDVYKCKKACQRQWHGVPLSPITAEDY